MRLIRPLLALAVASAIAGLPVAVAEASPPVPSTSAAVGTPTDASALGIEIVPGDSGVVAPGVDLPVQVRLTNSGEDMIPAGVASVFVARSPVDDRAELTGWLLAEPDTPGGTPVAQVETPVLLPGRSATLPSITIAAASVPFLTASSFRVHELAVSVAAGDADPVTARGAVTVDPGTGTPAVPIAFAMPLTVPPSTSGIIPADLLATYTDTSGLLDRQLEQAAALPVAIAVDPRIIASIQLLGTSAPESAVAWLERLRSVPNETFALSYADGDITATSQAGLGVLAPTSFAVDPSLFPAVVDTSTTDAATPTTDPTGSVSPSPSATDATPNEPVVPTLDELLAWSYTLQPIAWPRDDTVVAADLDVFAAAGSPTTIVASTNSSAASGDDAPAASATANGHAVLTSDAALSTLLREAVAAPDPVSWQSALARLSAALAASADGAASPDSIVLATLDRSWPENVDFRLTDTVSAVDALPWAASATLADAQAQAPVAITVTDTPAAADRIALLQQLQASEVAVGQFATVLTDPTLITGERRLSLLGIASQAWASADSGWAGAANEYLTRSNELLTSVNVTSTTLVQTSDTGDLPIVITNALDYPVDVQVLVTASSAILDIRTPTVTLSVPANSQKRALVQASSIANGEVTLSISLLSNTGVPLSTPAFVDVTVSAGWETAATTVLAVLVFAVFILGIVRTVRRRRRIARGELEDDREGDVLDLNDAGTDAEAPASDADSPPEAGASDADPVPDDADTDADGVTR